MSLWDSIKQWICGKDCCEALMMCDIELEDIRYKYNESLITIQTLTDASIAKDEQYRRLKDDYDTLQYQFDMAIQEIEEMGDDLQEALELSHEACAAGVITPYWFLIASVAAQYHMDPYMLAGVIQSESGFDPIVYGDSGLALGLGQFHIPAWNTAWPGLEDRRRMDPKYAIEGIARYFCINWQDIQATYPDITDHKWGWAAYTGGPGMVGSYLHEYGDDWERFDEWTKTKVDRYYSAAQRFRDRCEEECEICSGR